MYRILTPEPIEATNGAVDLDFTDPARWPPYVGDGFGITAMLGDEHAGPMVFLSSFPPADEQMPTGFAHAHASDNWRITVRGTTNMGRDAYTEGQFRFQDGGVPYPSDNVAWGPDGGFGIIMFADRRGFAMRPVKAEIAERVVPQQEKTGKALGIEVCDPCPGAPAIATSFGGTTRGQLVSGFECADSWPEVSPGVALGVALLGEPSSGPVMFLTRADSGATALPERRLSTEVVQAVISGAATIGGDALPAGRVRIEEADTGGAPVVAGPEGLSLVTIIADRRAVSDLAAAFGDGPWTSGVANQLNALHAELAASN